MDISKLSKDILGLLRTVVSARTSKPAYLVIAVLLVANIVLLLIYQQRLSVNFPFADEWGYLDRLRQLPDIGLFHYLFDRYQTYFIPVFLLIWYACYALSHLDLMLLRYVGAFVSGLSALLLCVMLLRKSTKPMLSGWLAILCAPFVVCSLNHGAAYSQAIESLAEPLLFGLVLAATWAAEETLRPGRAWFGVVVCIAAVLLAVGIYAPPLMLLAAIVAARFMLRPRFDWPLGVLAFAAVGLPLWYLKASDPGNAGSLLGAFTPGNVPKALIGLMGLMGTAVSSPVSSSYKELTLFIGAAILCFQVIAVIHVFRLPVEQRLRFFVPMTLTLYAGLVFVEIFAARVNAPDMAFTPRYSTHMLGGVVSALFWVVMLGGSRRWERWVANTVLAVVIVGVALAEWQGMTWTGYIHNSMSRVRETLLSLHAAPNATQQHAMFINDPLEPLVYPGMQFMRDHHLALFREPIVGNTAVITIEITGFGPRRIKGVAGSAGVSNTAGVDIWVRLDHALGSGATLVVDGQRVHTYARSDVLTAVFPESLLHHPGSYPVYAIVADGNQSIRSEPVEITVY